MASRRNQLVLSLLIIVTVFLLLSVPIYSQNSSIGVFENVLVTPHQDPSISTTKLPNVTLAIDTSPRSVPVSFHAVWQTTDNHFIRNYIVKIYLLEGLFIFELGQVNTTTSQIDAEIDLSNVPAGSHNVTLEFRAEGYETQLVNLVILTLDPHSYEIIIDMSEVFIQGEALVFGIIVNGIYPEGSISARNQAFTFLITTSHESGGNITQLHSSTTNERGIAIIVFDAEFTIDLLNVTSIELYLLEFGETVYQTTFDTGQYPILALQEPEVSLETKWIFVTILTILMLSVIGAIIWHWRSQTTTMDQSDL